MIQTRPSASIFFHALDYLIDLAAENRSGSCIKNDDGLLKRLRWVMLPP